MSVIDVARARRECAARQDIVTRALADYRNQHGAPAVSGPIDAVMKTAAALLTKTEATQVNEGNFLSAEGIDKSLRSWRQDAATKFQAALRDFDNTLGAMVKTLAKKALPNLPAGIDEMALRAEVQMLLASTGQPQVGLMTIASGPRRDLAAVVLSPWGASLASTFGMKPGDVAALRTLAMRGSVQHGTDAQRAAADEYLSATRVLPIRQVLGEIIDESTGGASASGIDLHYPSGDAVNVYEWAGGPQDAPPMVELPPALPMPSS